MIEDLDIPGSPTGRLAGRRFAVKDVIDVDGVPTTAGSPVWAASHPVPDRHAPVVRRLLEAGASLAGKAISDELAFSVDGTNPHHGMPPNPAAPGHIPGGSSSGSASAVASGDVDFALGTDTGGSVRVPASYCGVFGIRPSWGSTDTTGVVPLAPSFDTVGWFARDAGTLHDVGEVLLDRTPPPGASDARLTLLPFTEAFELAAPGVADAVLVRLRETFGDAVAAPRSLAADLTDWAAVRYAIQSFETWRAHGALAGSRLADLGTGVGQRLAACARTTRSEYDAARRRRDEIVHTLDRLVAPGVVLCLPTTPAPAPAVAALGQGNDARRRGVFALGALAGLWGSPEVSMPGARVDGIPVGASLVGRPGDDLRLLDLLRSTAPGPTSSR
jgi:amidase